MIDIVLILEFFLANVASEFEVFQLSHEEFVDLITDHHIVCFASRADVRLFWSTQVAGPTLHSVAPHALDRIYQYMRAIIRAPEIFLVAQVV